MRYEGEEKKIGRDAISIIRLILLFVIPIVAYGVAIFPTLFS